MDKNENAEKKFEMMAFIFRIRTCILEESERERERERELIRIIRLLYTHNDFKFEIHY